MATPSTLTGAASAGIATRNPVGVDGSAIVSRFEGKGNRHARTPVPAAQVGGSAEIVDGESVPGLAGSEPSPGDEPLVELQAVIRRVTPRAVNPVLLMNVSLSSGLTFNND